MSWRDTLARWIAAPKAQSDTVSRNASTWQSWGDDFFNAPLSAPTESSALAVSAIYGCVNIIAGAIAALPVEVYRRAPDGELDVMPSDGLWWVLNEEMLPRWNAANGWEFLCQSLLLHGDGFAVIQRNVRSEPSGLLPVHPDRVYVAINPAGQRLVYLVHADPTIPGDKDRVYDQDDVIHIAGFGFDGRRGLSPLRNALRMSGATAISMQDFSAQFFKNSARPDFVLQSEAPISEEVSKAIYAKLDERNAVSGGAHRPMVLGGGLKFQPITMPLSDVQLLDQRRFQIEEICRIYGVPPFMVGHTEKTTSWGSGVEQMGVGFVRYALRQHLNKIETELNRKLFRTASRVCKFDTTELERADTKTLFEALRIGIGRAGEKPIISVNESRAVLRRKRVEGGDDMSVNLAAGKAASNEKPTA